MSKILDWIKHHKWQTVLIGFGLFFLPLIIVHIAYRIPAISPWFASDWESGELITYIAGFEAFLGTVALGAIAIHQNDKANEINDRLVEIEDKQTRFDRQPRFSINAKDSEFVDVKSIYNKNGPTFYSKLVCDTIDYSAAFWDREFFYFSFTFKNLSTYNINVRLQKLEILNIGDETSRIKYEQDPFTLHLEDTLVFPDQETELGFILDGTRLSEKAVKMGHLRLIIANDSHEEYLYKMSFLIVTLMNNTYGIYRSAQAFDKIKP